MKELSVALCYLGLLIMHQSFVAMSMSPQGRGENLALGGGIIYTDTEGSVL